MKGNYEMYKVSTILSNGKKIEYQVIMTFINPNNNKNYLIYTDNTIDQSNKIRFYAGIYDPKITPAFLGEPTTKEEWIYINNVLNKVIPPK